MLLRSQKSQPNFKAFRSALVIVVYAVSIQLMYLDTTAIEEAFEDINTHCECAVLTNNYWKRCICSLFY